MSFNKVLEVQATGEKDEATEPRARRIQVRKEGRGVVRLVLDVNGKDDEHDLFVERQQGKWVVLLHKNGGDPVLAVQITDDAISVEDGMGVALCGLIPAEPVQPGEENDGQTPWYCQSCDYHGVEDEFWDDNVPNEEHHRCPECASTDCFFCD